jgi:hypothetical protein
MNWAMDSAWTVPTRLSLTIVALLGFASHSGCARMSAFSRGEPPMIGGPSAPATTAKRPGAPGAPGVASPGLTRGRSASTNDLYAQSFGRTRPRTPSSDSAAARGTETVSEADPVEPIETPESGVQMAALAPSTDSSKRLGVDLRPPVDLRVSSYSTAPLNEKPADPTQPVSAPIATPRESPDSLDSAARNAPPEADRESPAEPTAESLVAASQARLDRLTSYRVLIKGQERIGETLQEPEDVLLSLRRKPRAVRLEWRDGPHRGREVIFSETETNGLMLVNMGDSAIPLPRLALAPTSPLALRNSRHPITDAGFDTILVNLRKTIDENKRGDHSHGRISYAGMEQPEPLDHPCHKLVRVTATAEVWNVYIDPVSELPAMVEGHTGGKELLERFIFRKIEADPSELAGTDAFDPNRRWGEDQGLLNRIARASKVKKNPDDATQ